MGVGRQLGLQYQSGHKVIECLTDASELWLTYLTTATIPLIFSDIVLSVQGLLFKFVSFKKITYAYLYPYLSLQPDQHQFMLH